MQFCSRVVGCCCFVSFYYIHVYTHIIIIMTDSQTLVDAAGGCTNDGRPLHYRPCPIPDTSALMQVAVTQDTAAEVVRSEVAAARVIDLHTHLLPPSHGSLCLWGIDELLSYVRTLHICFSQVFSNTVETAN